MFSIKMLAEEIARRSSGRLTSLMLGGAEELSVTRFAPLESAGAEHVAFIAQAKLRGALKDSRAGVIVMREADREAVWGAAEPDRTGVCGCTRFPLPHSARHSTVIVPVSATSTSRVTYGMNISMIQ